MISLIWAMDKNNLIGKNNKIPWHVKEDLIYFKECTKNKDVLMGYNTYISLKGYYKNRKLPYGRVFVASKKSDLNLSDAIVINDAVTFLKNVDFDLFVIGGGSIYNLALAYSDYLYISLIKGDFFGDTYFPKFNLDMFQLISERETEKVVYKIYKRDVGV